MVENGGTSGVIAEIAAKQSNDDDANNGEQTGGFKKVSELTKKQKMLIR